LSLLPRTLFGRLALLMTGGLLVAQLIGVAMHMTERQRTLGAAISQEFAQRVAAIHRAIDSTPIEDRPRLAERLGTGRLRVAVADCGPPLDAVPAAGQAFLDRLAASLGPEVEVRPVALPHVGGFAFDVCVGLGSGGWLRVEGGAPKEIFDWPFHLFLNLAVMLTVVSVLIWYVARITVKPLTRLATAANRLGDDLKQPPLPEDGPSEVQEAARAFNSMQRRIRQHIEERERFLAAVSHDLKTPVTRLRLRSEMLADAGLRERYLRDLDDMQQMLTSALEFLRGRTADEPVHPIDMVAMLESLVDDWAELGREIPLQAPACVRLSGRPQALRRAIGNLIENALKYGGKASVALVDEPARVTIVVDDEGPGLPGDMLEKVLEPFYRSESSRSRETGGVGLGLAIVRQIVLAHGGTIRLENRPAGGLRATLSLPRPAAG